MPLTDPVWSQALSPEFGKPYFVKLLAFLAKQAAAGKAIYPPKDKVFHALNTCPLDRVRVVILGQDPYHGPGQAHGLSFSVAQGVAQPPSLRNIVKEATACCGTKPTKNGCLTPWAVQGVLLLNTVLTVEKGAPLSHHKKGWEQFTDEVVRLLNRQERTIVFLLWGKPSQQKGAHINRARHRVITCSHPSPLGATKTKEPFTGSRCFARANDMLVKSGQEPIDWNLE
ncbi:uracil-DNA glycosylase-like protein [Tribonema minus]|uniref:Uracil-DNA glycosylase n=1 Tax=Tribonema minus TaxID=303371 RepID=A0A836CBN7_9STRA|nr:uracil-DNA glycosylase-like protein [Tribonema minus]